MSESIFEPVYPFQTGTENPLEQYDRPLQCPKAAPFFLKKASLGTNPSSTTLKCPQFPRLTLKRRRMRS